MYGPTTYVLVSIPFTYNTFNVVSELCSVFISMLTGLTLYAKPAFFLVGLSYHSQLLGCPLKFACCVPSVEFIFVLCL